MSVVVVVPFRDAEDGWRAPAFWMVSRWLREALPDARHVVADAGGDMFHKARSLNEAVAASSESVIVMCDADTLIPHHLLHEAVGLAAVADGLVLPFDEMLHATREATHRALNLELLDRLDGDVWKACPTIPLVGSVNVLSRATWAAVGGWPESYVGWGGEDVAFARRCARIAPTRRLEGRVTHLWHPKTGDYYAPETIAANRQRLEEDR